MRRLAITFALLAMTASADLAAQSPAAPARVPVPANGHYADVNGVHLYYELHGAGKPLVLLHGGMGSGGMFGENLQRLATGRQVILVDLQAHGRTADVDRPLDATLMADDVAALVRHLGFAKADVMGFSMGAMVALRTAIQHPDVVDRLVLVSVIAKRAAFYPDILGAQSQVNAAAAEAMKQTPMYAHYASIAPRPEDWPRFVDKIGRTMRMEYDWMADVPRVTAPTLVMQGDADIVPPSHAVELFTLLGGGQRDGGWDGSGMPRSRLAILPGTTHYTIAEDPRMAETAAAFLAGR